MKIRPMQIITALLGGGLLVYTIFVLSPTKYKALSDEEINKYVCVQFNYDRLGEQTVSGSIEFTYGTTRANTTTEQQSYKHALQTLVDEHNKNASGSKYVLISDFSPRVTARPFRGMLTAIVCQPEDLKKCRNRNIWFYRPMAPEQLASLVVPNALAAKADLSTCRAGAMPH